MLVEETVRVVVAVPPGERLTLFGLSEAVGALARLELDTVGGDRLTVPLKPPKAFTVIVDVLGEEPCANVRELGLGESENDDIAQAESG